MVDTKLETNLDVLIIGAGQAGLAMGYHLKQTSLRFQLIESNARIGDSWRKRYDSLHLFTPRMYSALPGLALTGDSLGFASKEEFANYLENYANHFALPILLNTSIKNLQHVNGNFIATTNSGESITAKAVVVATGAFQKPTIPSVGKQFSNNVLQFTAENYRNPTQVPAGTVLVVGDGATGRDIASELAETKAHQVFLATGKPRRLLPDKILNRSAWWWFDKLGILRLSPNNRLGRLIRKSDPFPGRGKDFKQLALKGIKVMPRLTKVENKKVTFSNEISAEVDTVIWATGYQDNSDWVEIPQVKDTKGQFIHQRGISPVNGLYFIGRPWQTSRSSALVVGVGTDAELLTKEIKNLHTASKK